MRLPLVSLIALAAATSVVAQPAPPPPAPPAATPPASTTPAQPTAAATPGATPATAPPAGTTAETAQPPAPPPPPAPPTDPTAVALLNILQQVCIPAAKGGNFVQLVKAAGLRKQGDQGWALRQKDFTLLVDNPSFSNPGQCHVQVTHPADLEAPGRPIIVALNDWAGVTNGWTLYRNDKNVQGGVQFTTRSWQLDWNGEEQSLVFTTKRKPDGTPLHPNSDESEMIYGVAKIG
jgi:hypothetical protein